VLVALVVFVVWSIIELFAMVQIAGAIGVLPTIFAVVAMSFAGLWLMKIEGLGVLRRMSSELDRGQAPTDEVVNGALIVVGGVLMFIPGFVTGAVGLALLLPPVRALVRPIVVSRATRRLDAGRAGFTVFSRGFRAGFPSGVGGGRVYDVDSHLDSAPPNAGPGSTGGTELGS